jgi:hydroxymethylbilane synthase
MKDVCLLGTRGSALAMAQAREVLDRLRVTHPRLSFDFKIIKTTGDKMKSGSLAKSGTKGLFTKELEQALVQRKIALAVHSLKDLPTAIPAGLAVAAVPEREDPRDVLIFKEPAWSPANGGTVATSSPRRQFQLTHRWPRLKIVDMRGNVETRLGKLAENSQWDAIVLAAAGLKRLGYLSSNEPEFLTFEKTPILRYRWLELDEMVPAPGQAALAIEVLAEDERACSLAAPLNRFRSQAETLAERSFLSAMGGGCLQPVAAIGRARAERLTLRGVVFSIDGSRRWEDELSGPLGEHETLGQRLAEQMKSKGAKL